MPGLTMPGLAAIQFAHRRGLPIGHVLVDLEPIERFAIDPETMLPDGLGAAIYAQGQLPPAPAALVCLRGLVVQIRADQAAPGLRSAWWRALITVPAGRIVMSFDAEILQWQPS